MSAVNYNQRKKYFRKNNYGKYYSYRRIRNIMNTYFRAKLSLQIDIIWENNTARFDPLGAQRRDNIFSNAELVEGCSSWEYYRNLFTFYKPRGMLIEVDPKFQNTGYFNEDTNVAHLPYNGDVAIALTNYNAVPTYRTLVDSNHFLILSAVSKQRVYWPFTIKDFTAVPIPGGNATGMPYWFVILMHGEPNANAVFPLWGIRVTYYVTFRQSNM